MKDMPEKIYADTNYFAARNATGIWFHKNYKHPAMPKELYLHAAKTRERLVEEFEADYEKHGRHDQVKTYFRLSQIINKVLGDE